MVGGTGLSYFVRIIPSSESLCASLDVFIRKSCDERCKHGLDGIFFHLRFHPTSSSLSLSLSLSLSRIYKVINYFSLLFNTTANLWSVVFDTTPASLICRCRHFSGAIQTCLYAPQILLVPLASNTAAWNCAKPLIVQSFLLLSLFSFYRNFSRFFKRMNRVIVSKFCPKKFISLKFEQPALYQYTSLHFIFLKRVSTLKHYQNLSLKKNSTISTQLDRINLNK